MITKSGLFVAYYLNLFAIMIGQFELDLLEVFAVTTKKIS